MKILFLGEPDSPNTQSWVDGLRDAGCEVILASVRSDGSDGAVPIGNTSLPPRIRILTGVRQLKKIIAKEKPDILLAYRITSYGYLAAKTNFHPLVLAAQNEQIVYLPKPSIIRYKFLERCAKFAISKADLMHSWGKNITEGLIKFGADKDKILTLHRGIDINSFSPESQKNINTKKNNDLNASIRGINHKHISSRNTNIKGSKKQALTPLVGLPLNPLVGFNIKAPVFLSTRSLAPEYLIEDLINAFQLVVQTIPLARLEIAGSGSEEEILKEQVKQLDLENNITFHGRLNKDQLINLLYSSDIYISIIQTEGISSSLIEGIAAKLLPLVAKMSASETLINVNVNGFLITDITPKQLSKTMLNAIESYSKMKTEIDKNSNKIIDNFSREKNQDIFIKQYKKLLY